MYGIQRLEPSLEGSGNSIRIGGPEEGFGMYVGFGDESIDGGLKIDERKTDTAFGASVCELGEKFFDGVEPRADVGVKRTWVRF